MQMVASAKRWTVDEVLTLPEDGRRYELIDGVLFVNGVEVLEGDLAAVDAAMTPSPTWTHQNAVFELARLLANYVDRQRAGHVMVAPADVSVTPIELVQPDVFVVPLVGGKVPVSWEEAGSLLLAAEVLSPSSARTDRVIKRQLCQRAGVPQYWIVDADARLVERWTPDDTRGEQLTDELTWLPSGAAEPFVMDVAAYFATVHGTRVAG